MVLAAADAATSQILSDTQIQQAIDLGVRYKSRDKLWDREFHKTNDFIGRGRTWQARAISSPSHCPDRSRR
jgi:hypothetical protein